MSKMYEALQYAYNLEKLQKKAEVASPFTHEEVENKADLFPPVLRTIPKCAPSEGVDAPVRRMAPEMVRLKQSIAAQMPDTRKNIIQFLGSREGEGTSTIVRELAQVFSSQGNKSVLLIDMSFRYSAQHQAFGVRTRVPLEAIIKEGGSIDAAISHVKNSKISLCLLSEETAMSSNGEWLVCDGRLVWEPIRKQFDIILIDSPSINASVDGLTLCPTVDGVVIVVEAEKSRGPVVQRLKSQIIKSGGNILGIVFNKQQYHIPEWLYKRLE